MGMNSFTFRLSTSSASVLGRGLVKLSYACSANGIPNGVLCITVVSQWRLYDAIQY